MTGIYQAIEYRLWKKDIVRLGKKSAGELVTISHIQKASRARVEGFVTDEISLLELLAFTGLHNGTIDFGSELRNKIADQFVPDLLLDKTLPCLSFLRTSDPTSESYHFLHLTYQEYFAARHFVQQWVSGQGLKCLELETRQGPAYWRQERYTADGYLRKHNYNGRYNIFWRFVAGLLQAKGDNQLCDFFSTIENEPRDLLGPGHQRLVMHCLSEVVPSLETPKLTELREDREARLKQWLFLNCNLDHLQIFHNWQPRWNSQNESWRSSYEKNPKI